MRSVGQSRAHSEQIALCAVFEALSAWFVHAGSGAMLMRLSVSHPLLLRSQITVMASWQVIPLRWRSDLLGVHR